MLPLDKVGDTQVTQGQRSVTHADGHVLPVAANAEAN